MIKAMVPSMLCVVISVLTAHADGVWSTDFEKAKADAAKTGLPILANFSGSDWCGWCIKLDKEVFSKKDFLDAVKDKFILFEADFPNKKKQPDAIKAQNEQLARQYRIAGFPTVLLLDKDGKVLATTGYRPGGPVKYVEHLDSLLKGSE